MGRVVVVRLVERRVISGEELLGTETQDVGVGGNFGLYVHKTH